MSFANVEENGQENVAEISSLNTSDHKLNGKRIRFIQHEEIRTKLLAENPESFITSFEVRLTDSLV